MSSVFVFIRSRRENYSEENTTSITTQIKQPQKRAITKDSILKKQEII